MSEKQKNVQPLPIKPSNTSSKISLDSGVFSSLLDAFEFIQEEERIMLKQINQKTIAD